MRRSLVNWQFRSIAAGGYVLGALALIMGATVDCVLAARGVAVYPVAGVHANEMCVSSNAIPMVIPSVVWWTQVNNQFPVVRSAVTEFDRMDALVWPGICDASYEVNCHRGFETEAIRLLCKWSPSVESKVSSCLIYPNDCWLNKANSNFIGCDASCIGWISKSSGAILIEWQLAFFVSKVPQRADFWKVNNIVRNAWRYLGNSTLRSWTWKHGAAQRVNDSRSGSVIRDRQERYQSAVASGPALLVMDRLLYIQPRPAQSSQTCFGSIFGCSGANDCSFSGDAVKYQSGDYSTGPGNSNHKSQFRPKSLLLGCLHRVRLYAEIGLALILGVAAGLSVYWGLDGWCFNRPGWKQWLCASLFAWLLVPILAWLMG